MSLLIKIYQVYCHFLEKYLSPVLIFALRLYIANIFWFSGLAKINGWQSTIYLFTNTFKVPLLTPIVAAGSCAFFELTCSLLLVLGLATRAACLPLLLITLVIYQIFPGPGPEVWAIFLLLILAFGPKALSMDAWLKSKLYK